MTDSFDYPAAHSMDTMWFAVDRDGHVAAFNSNEAGAVPEAAYLGEGEDYGVVTAIRRRIQPRPLAFVRAGNLHAPLRGLDHRASVGPMPLLVFVEAQANADALVAAGGHLVHASEGLAVVLTEPAEAAITALHDRGECRGCFGLIIPEEDRSDDPNLAGRGLYYYVHDMTENGLAGPYSQLARPLAPITREMLPKEAREKLVEFPGRFADTPGLQPVEWWPSHAWGAAFLTSDLKTIGPLPGREDDYRAEYEELIDYEEDGFCTVMRPGESTKGPKKPWWKPW